MTMITPSYLGETIEYSSLHACRSTLEDPTALNVAAIMGDAAGQAICTFSLGNAYVKIVDVRNLDEAERWYRQSLDLHIADDAFGRGRCLGKLGLVAYERFKDARTARRPTGEFNRHLAESAQLCHQALDMMPATAVMERGVIHDQLGLIYRDAGDIDRAQDHFRQGIRYADEADDTFSAGQTRYNVATTLLGAGRQDDARAYAEAALTNYQTFGDRAAAEIEKTKHLIAEIDRAIAKKGGRM